MVLSFAVKVKLSAFALFSFVKLWRELRTRCAFDRYEVSNMHEFSDEERSRKRSRRFNTLTLGCNIKD